MTLKNICRINTSAQKFLFILILFTSLSTVAITTYAYTPPLGIPVPSFGIDETHTMYVGQQYDYNGDGTPDGAYGDAGNGPYTHYVDMNSGACTDTDNAYGTQVKPRCTFPSGSSFKPGAVIEIHGGVYVSPAKYQITSSGTAQKPIFFRGVSVTARPVFERVLRVRGSYIIIENMDFNKNNRAEMSVDICPDTTLDPIGTVHHVSMRYCEVHNYYKDGKSSGAVTAASTYVPGDTVHNIVFFRNKIHPDNIVIFNPIHNMEADLHGVGVTGHTEYVWILENEIYGCSGDGVGNGHAANYTAKYYYIGGNDIHTGGENAIDLKEVDTAIISSNKMHDFQGLSAGSDGTAAVFHYGPTYSPKNIWLINNEIYDCLDNGVQIGGSQQWPVYILGNVIHDIHNANNTGNGITTWAMDDLHIINNTITNVDNGLNLSGTGTVNTSTLYLYNNIISGMAATGKHLYIDGSAYLTRVNASNNLIYQSSGSLNIMWGTTLYTSISGLQTGTGKCTDCIQWDPLFLDQVNKDYRLKFRSPASEKALTPDIYTTFQERFGLDIRKDKRGATRPIGLKWDIGAYEIPSPVGTSGTFK